MGEGSGLGGGGGCEPRKLVYKLICKLVYELICWLKYK